MAKKACAIKEIRETVINFLRETLNVKELKIIKVANLEEGWEVVAEVYEESAFIKSLGLPSRVMDRNFYVVELNNSLEVESYKLEKEQLEPAE